MAPGLAKGLPVSGRLTQRLECLLYTEEVRGSNPLSSTVVVSCWFDNLAVNEVYGGSIPLDHPCTILSGC